MTVELPAPKQLAKFCGGNRGSLVDYVEKAKEYRGELVDYVEEAGKCYPPTVQSLCGSGGTFVVLQQEFYLRSVRGVGPLQRLAMGAMIEDRGEPGEEEEPMMEDEEDEVEVVEGPKEGEKKRGLSAAKVYRRWETPVRIISNRKGRGCNKRPKM